MAEGMQPCAGCGAVCNTNLLSCPACGLISFWKVAADRATWRYSRCHVCGTPVPWLKPPEVCPNPHCQQPQPLAPPINILPGKAKIGRVWSLGWPLFITAIWAAVFFMGAAFFGLKANALLPQNPLIRRAGDAPSVPYGRKPGESAEQAAFNTLAKMNGDVLQMDARSKRYQRDLKTANVKAAPWFAAQSVCVWLLLASPLILGGSWFVVRTRLRLERIKDRYL